MAYAYASLSDSARSAHWPLAIRERAAGPVPAIPPANTADDPDGELFELGERCAEAYMEAAVMECEAMTLLARFDQREGWKPQGFGSAAEWLAWRTGVTLGTARERVRTALALEKLPVTSAAMKNGELSFSKVRALTRAATPDNEAQLLEFARAGSTATLERVVRGWKKLDRTGEVRAEQLRHRTRTFSAWVDDDGMVVVKGRLDPEVGAALMRAVEAASDALFRATDDAPADDAANDTEPQQRRADAIGLIAERALAAGFGGEGAPVSGSRAERYQVMLHVDPETLAAEGEPGQSELEEGTRVSGETSRRIACDSGVVRIARDNDGSVVGVGRKTRSVPPSVRRALEVRDRGCRFPGCGLRFTDAHHVKHWADGGETSLRNLVLLCRKHHRAVHEGGVRVCLDVEGKVAFFAPNGEVLADAPPKPDRPVVPKRRLDTEARSALPRHRLGASKWAKDSQVPWEAEAAVWEVLDG